MTNSNRLQQKLSTQSSLCSLDLFKKYMHLYICTNLCTYIFGQPKFLSKRPNFISSTRLIILVEVCLKEWSGITNSGTESHSQAGIIQSSDMKPEHCLGGLSCSEGRGDSGSSGSPTSTLTPKPNLRRRRGNHSSRTFLVTTKKTLVEVI